MAHLYRIPVVYVSDAVKVLKPKYDLEGRDAQSSPPSWVYNLDGTIDIVILGDGAPAFASEPDVKDLGEVPDVP